MGFTKSNRLVLSYDQGFTPNVRRKLETYYQFHHDVPVEEKERYFSLSNYGASYHQARVDSLVNEGYGKGVEFTLEKSREADYEIHQTEKTYERQFDDYFRGDTRLSLKFTTKIPDRNGRLT